MLEDVLGFAIGLAMFATVYSVIGRVARHEVGSIILSLFICFALLGVAGIIMGAL